MAFWMTKSYDLRFVVVFSEDRFEIDQLHDQIFWLVSQTSVENLESLPIFFDVFGVDLAFKEGFYMALILKKSFR